MDNTPKIAKVPVMLESCFVARELLETSLVHGRALDDDRKVETHAHVCRCVSSGYKHVSLISTYIYI